MKRIMVLLAATLGLFLSAAPSFSQTGGYPPGPTTTSTAVPGGAGGAPGAVGGSGGSGGAGGTGASVGAGGALGGTGGSAVVKPFVLAQAPPPAAAVRGVAAGAGTRVAVTGANAIRLASIGLVLFMAGFLLVTVTRRRRDRTAYLSG